MNRSILTNYLQTKNINPVIEHFDYVSYRGKSVPGAGSRCYKIHSLDLCRIGQVYSVIAHRPSRNGQPFTVQTEKGFFKFWPRHNHD